MSLCVGMIIARIFFFFLNGYLVQTTPLGSVESSEERFGEHVVVVVARSTRIAGVPRRAGPKDTIVAVIITQVEPMFPDVLGFRKKPPLEDIGLKCYSAVIDYIWIIYKLRERS